MALSNSIADELCEDNRDRIAILDAAFSDPLLKDSASLTVTNLGAYHDAQEFAEDAVERAWRAAENVLRATPKFDSFDYYLMSAVEEVSSSMTALHLAFMSVLPELLENPAISSHYHELKDAVDASERAADSMYFKALYVVACNAVSS